MAETPCRNTKIAPSPDTTQRRYTGVRGIWLNQHWSNSQNSPIGPGVQRMQRLQRAAMARTKPRNRAWQRAGTRGLSGPGPALGPALGPAHAPTPAACAERYPDPPRSLAASHPATTDTGRQPGAGTPPCSSLRAMIVDHRAFLAVAGFQRVHDQGPRPPRGPPVCQPVPCSWQVTAGTHRQGRRRLVGGESRRAGRRPRRIRRR